MSHISMGSYIDCQVMSLFQTVLSIEFAILHLIQYMPLTRDFKLQNSIFLRVYTLLSPYGGDSHIIKMISNHNQDKRI